MSSAIDTTINSTQEPVDATADVTQQLTFNLGEEQYGVDILRVKEIKGYTEVTRLPNIPEFVKGVLNLRGTIVPIVSLRKKFGMEEIDYTMFTVIVVVVVKDRIMGMIVDSVEEVLSLASTDVKPPPEFGMNVNISFIRCIGTAGDRLVTLLDIDRVLSAEETVQLANISES